MISHGTDLSPCVRADDCFPFLWGELESGVLRLSTPVQHGEDYDTIIVASFPGTYPMDGIMATVEKGQSLTVTHQAADSKDIPFQIGYREKGDLTPVLGNAVLRLAFGYAQGSWCLLPNPETDAQAVVRYERGFYAFCCRVVEAIVEKQTKARRMDGRAKEASAE